jgi:hypothetical protein
MFCSFGSYSHIGFGCQAHGNLCWNSHYTFRFGEKPFGLELGLHGLVLRLHTHMEE